MQPRRLTYRLNRHPVIRIYKKREPREASHVATKHTKIQLWELTSATREEDRDNPCMFNMNMTQLTDASRDTSETSIH